MNNYRNMKRDTLKFEHEKWQRNPNFLLLFNKAKSYIQLRERKKREIMLTRSWNLKTFCSYVKHDNDAYDTIFFPRKGFKSWWNILLDNGMGYSSMCWDGSHHHPSISISALWDISHPKYWDGWDSCTPHPWKKPSHRI